MWKAAFERGRGACLGLTGSGAEDDAFLKTHLPSSSSLELGTLGLQQVWEWTGSPNGAAEEDRVLQDDGQARAQGVQWQFGDVNAIDDDAAYVEMKSQEAPGLRERVLGCVQLGHRIQ